MRFIVLSALAALGVVAACGGGGATPDSPNGTSSGSPALPAAGQCGVDKICLDVPADRNAVAYRIAVFWYQLDDDGPDPTPQITYDQPVAAGTAHLEIALASIGAPTDDKLFECDRGGGDDENVSPCISEPKVTYGVVFTYQDDGDGKVTDPSHLKKDTPGDKVLGFGNLVMGYAPAAYPKGSAATNRDFWDRAWPDGIEQGVHVYQVMHPDSGFDRPIHSPAGTTNVIQEKAPNVT